MDLSISTLQFTDFIVFATCGTVFAACWFLRRTKLHFLLFAASYFVCAGMSVWFVDFGYYGSVWSPLGWSLAGSLFWSGFRVFDGRSPMAWPMAVLIALPTSVHILLAALGSAPETINAGSTIAYAIHEAAVAHYVITRGPSRSPIRLLAGIALLVIAVAICLPILPLAPHHGEMSIVAIFIIDHVTSILLTTFILALEAEKAYSAVDKLARTDPLTQILNRHGLASVAEDHPGRACVILADLDHFKAVNDQFGHAAGDEVLREFARRAQSVLPEGGHLARLGGEEFVLLFDAKDAQTGLGLAEHLRTVIASRPVPWRDESIPITVSAGVAMLNARSGLRSAIEKADAALYEAKLAGRDCVKAA